jgi:hypothetical protein
MPATDTMEALTGEVEEERQSTLPAPDEAILRMRHAIAGGQHWFEALLDAVGRWRLARETVRRREYSYVIGGDAFDWLLLAERILDEVRDIVPSAEAAALLYDGQWPIDMDDDEFAARLGREKYSAHLNYLYGVLVEEALQLYVEEEIHKESRSRAWGQDPREDLSMYSRVYGMSRAQLLERYYETTGILLQEKVPYADWKAFTYWLFKQRLKIQDKARVASDTRKGLAQLSRMELAVSSRRRGGRLAEEDFARRFSA